MSLHSLRRPFSCARPRNSNRIGNSLQAGRTRVVPRSDSSRAQHRQPEVAGTMITAKAIWTDNERYVGEASSHHAIMMDTATEKTASTPMELVLIALCGCTASDVVGILRKKREPFTSLEVSASGERASGDPPVYTEITLV